MVNISKQKLSVNQKEKLAKQFTTFMRGELAPDLFCSFFTETEQILFMKRLAAIFMIHHGYSSYRIAVTLHLSDATVLQYRKQYKAGNYTPITKRFRSRAFKEITFWQVLETLLRAGLPPMAGPGRWEKIAPSAVRGSYKNK